MFIWLNILNLALEFDCGHKARVAIDGVGDLLDEAVGQQHVVKALSVVTVAGFLVAKVVAGVMILNGPVEGVDGFLAERRARVGQFIYGIPTVPITGWGRPPGFLKIKSTGDIGRNTKKCYVMILCEEN